MFTDIIFSLSTGKAFATVVLRLDSHTVTNCKLMDSVSYLHNCSGAFVSENNRKRHEFVFPMINLHIGTTYSDSCNFYQYLLIFDFRHGDINNVKRCWCSDDSL